MCRKHCSHNSVKSEKGQVSNELKPFQDEYFQLCMKADKGELTDKDVVKMKYIEWILSN